MYVDDIKNWPGRQNINPTWKVPMKHVDLGEPTSFLDHVHLCTQREYKTSTDIVDNYKICSNPGSSRELQKNYLVRGDLMKASLHGPMIWRVMQRSVWKDIATWQTKQLNRYTKSQLHALMTNNSKKKNWDLLENCQTYALKLSLKYLNLARTGRPDIPWSVNESLHEQSPNEPELVTNDYVD